jgi:hypothetical protein
VDGDPAGFVLTGQGYWSESEVGQTLTGRPGDADRTGLIAYNVTPASTKVVRNALEARETDTAETVTARQGDRTERGTLASMVEEGDERLWEQMHEFGGLAAVPFDPKPDGPRYAAMGDAVTVNVIEWIGVRVAAAEKENSHA